MDKDNFFPGLNKAVFTRIAEGWKCEFIDIERVSIHANCGERKSKYVIVVRLRNEARSKYDRDKFFDLIVRIEEAFKDDEIYTPPYRAREGDWGQSVIYFEDETLPDDIQPYPALILIGHEPGQKGFAAPEKPEDMIKRMRQEKIPIEIIAVELKKKHGLTLANIAQFLDPPPKGINLQPESLKQRGYRLVKRGEEMLRKKELECKNVTP